MSPIYGRRIDRNTAALKEALKWRGFYWWDATQGGSLGVDALLVGHGRIVPVECKVPSSSGRYVLTPHEAEVHAILEAHGVRVEILTDPASLEVLWRPMRDFYGSGT